MNQHDANTIYLCAIVALFAGAYGLVISGRIKDSDVRRIIRGAFVLLMTVIVVGVAVAVRR